MPHEEAPLQRKH